MKAVLLKDFRIPARRIAEAAWGAGGTNATRTNRSGAYYYSCSSHGGYVVDSRVLAVEEKKLIDKYNKPEQLQLLVQHRNDGDYVVAVSTSNFQRYYKKSRSFRYEPYLGPVNWEEMDIYLFEEDCDWAILEKFTDIRAKFEVTEDKRKSIIDDTFSRYYSKKEITEVV